MEHYLEYSFIISYNIHFKEKVALKSSPILSLSIAIKHNNYFSFSTQWSFCPWSACYPEEIHLERSKFECGHFETIHGSQAVYVTSFCPTQNWWEGEKPSHWLCILHKVSKGYFFQVVILLTIFNRRIWLTWLHSCHVMIHLGGYNCAICHMEQSAREYVQTEQL